MSFTPKHTYTTLALPYKNIYIVLNNLFDNLINPVFCSSSCCLDVIIINCLSKHLYFW